MIIKLIVRGIIMMKRKGKHIRSGLLAIEIRLKMGINIE
jgi:hypothetical protein